MNHRLCFEALDKTLRHILTTNTYDATNKLFGGMTIVLGGDFQQTLPIVENATRYDIVAASIINSYLWKSCITLTLTLNMRLASAQQHSFERNQVEQFNQWLMSIGNGTSPGVNLYDSIENEWVKIPNHFLVPITETPEVSIINAIYPDIVTAPINDTYYQKRAIITPKNESVHKINTIVLSMLQSEPHHYYSFDTIHGANNYTDDLEALFPVEYLNTVTAGSLPCHDLVLKLGVLIMLLRNINQPSGLCNGTRLIITSLGDRVLTARVITGSAAGKEVKIPRIVFLHRDDKLPFVLS